MAKDTTGRLHVQVKTGGKRKLSSKLWLERQLNDPYVAQARRDGLRSRAAYKLIEIDDKYHFLKPGISVVDLGAAPGGWSQIAARRVGAADGKGKVVAIDLLEMTEIVAKVFQSGADAALLAQLKRDFATVRHVKPASSRQDSSERYVLAMGFRGARPK